MGNLISFFKPSITGPDGKVSHRKLSVLHFIILLTWMIIKTANGSVFPEIAWIVVSGGAGLFSGLSVWQQKVNKLKDENTNHYNESHIDTEVPKRTFNH
jgi:hypothetical protein